MPDNATDTEYNANELEAPSWLNAQFIQKVLSDSEKSPELVVTDLKITPACVQGDHCASVMFRTTTEYTTSKGRFSKSLIIKTMPEDTLSQSHLFSTEIGMYTKVLPEFDRILQQVGDNTKLYVPCIYHSLEPCPLMIFEDLVPQGYTVIRDRPVTNEELRLVFTKLAKWHAVSMKVVNEQPDFLREFQYGLTEMPNFMNGSVVTGGMANFVNFLDKTPELKKYKSYFEKLTDSCSNKMADVWTEYRKNFQPDGYYVLSHGDFHLRNMMFRHNKDTAASEDVMLVDFQLSNLSPITADLTYSIYRVMEPPQRWDLGKDLINHYFNILEETLKKVGYKAIMPTLSGLWEQIRRHKHHDFFLMSTFMPMLLAVKQNTLKMHEIVQSPDLRKKIYFMDLYVEEIKHLLPKYEDMGLFKDL